MPRQGGSLQSLALVVFGCILAVGLMRLWSQPRYAVDLQQSVETLPFEIDGIHAIERAGGEPYRWTTDYAFIQIRHAFHLAPTFWATLTIRSERPDGPQPVTLLANEQPLATTGTTTNLRAYHVLVPHRPDAEGSLRFAAATPNYTPPTDPRRLGFITTAWTIAPIFTTPQLGPLTFAELLLVAVGGAVLLAWLGWWNKPLALTVGWSVPLALLVLRGFYQPAPLPFTYLAVIALLTTATLPWIVRSAWSGLGLAIIAIVITFSGALWPSWMTDDALISFRYAQNLAAGNGLVYNVGERVEGYTNFLWTMLAALVLALGGDPVAVSYYAGIVVALLVVTATFILARRLLGESWALAAAALVGTSHSLLLYTARGSGLETGLFALLLVVGSYLLLTERLGWAGAAFALATLTRPEGVLLLGLAGLVQLIQHRSIERGIWRMVGTFAIIVVPFFAWRFSYYGDLLPNTFYAKTGGGLTQAWRGVQHAGAFALFAGGPLLGLLLLLAVVVLLRSWHNKLEGRYWLTYAWLVVGLYTAYIIAVGGDHFPGYRFFVPILPFLALLLTVGAQQFANWGQGRSKQASAALAIMFVVGLSVFNLTRSTPFDDIVRGDDESVWLWRELGWWLGDHGQPGESMAAMGAGAIPYYSDRTTIDLLGLNDKHIARLDVEGLGTGVAGHEKRDPDYVLNERKPSYVPAIWADYFGDPLALKATGLYEKYEAVTRYGRRVILWKRIR